MGSTRLPGKAMMEVAGRPMTGLLLERISATKGADVIVVATTVDQGDDVIVDLCRSKGVVFYRGSEEDVLSRYHGAAVENALDVVVRVTGDCPMADPAVIGGFISAFLPQSRDGTADYLSNTVRRTYPRGYDTEVFTLAALETAHREAKEAHQREHVTPFIWEQEERFKVVHMLKATDDSDLRVTVDTEEDLRMLGALADALGPRVAEAGMDEVIEVLRKRPDIRAINADVRQKHLREG